MIYFTKDKVDYKFWFNQKGFVFAKRKDQKWYIVPLSKESKTLIGKLANEFRRLYGEEYDNDFDISVFEKYEDELPEVKVNECKLCGDKHICNI